MDVELLLKGLISTSLVFLAVIVFDMFLWLVTLMAAVCLVQVPPALHGCVMYMTHVGHNRIW